MTQPQQQQDNEKQQCSRTPTQGAPALPYEPNVSPDSVDVVGILPKDVHVDPDITEGHPGYEESGGSEVRPPLPHKSDKPR